MTERKPKPAPYSPTDTAETTSVDIFISLVDQSRLKLDIKERNKIPNIDGYKELAECWTRIMLQISLISSRKKAIRINLYAKLHAQGWES